MEKQRNKAASKIQALWRGHVVRRGPRVSSGKKVCLTNGENKQNQITHTLCSLPTRKARKRRSKLPVMQRNDAI